MECLTNAQLEALREFDTPTICNAIEGFGVRAKTTGYTDTSLRLRVSMEDKPMVGYARTGIISARYPADTRHNEVMRAYYKQYEGFDQPQVAVIQDLDPQPVGSFWGDVQATVHRALGCVGTVTSGGVRDVAEVVHPGDLIHADCHGAIVIPHEIAPRLAAACRQAVEAEDALLLPCRKALSEGRRVTADEVMAWRAEMTRRRAAIGK